MANPQTLPAIHPDVTLRPACPTDLPDLARLHLLAFIDDVLLRYVTPRCKEYPYHAYISYLLKFRNRFYGDPTSRYTVLEHSTHGIIGFVAWGVKGSCPLAEQWKAEHRHITRVSWLQRRLIGLENSYWQHCVDRATDPAARRAFDAAVANSFKDLEQHMFCFALAVHPDWRGMGFAKSLIQWGQNLGRDNGLPAVLSSSPMAYPLYIKLGFRETSVVHAPNMDVPLLLWEPEKLKGQWLEEDEDGRSRLKSR